MRDTYGNATTATHGRTHGRTYPIGRLDDNAISDHRDLPHENWIQLAHCGHVANCPCTYACHPGSERQFSFDITSHFDTIKSRRRAIAQDHPSPYSVSFPVIRGLALFMSFMFSVTSYAMDGVTVDWWHPSLPMEDTPVSCQSTKDAHPFLPQGPSAVDDSWIDRCSGLINDIPQHTHNIQVNTEAGPLRSCTHVRWVI